MRVHILHYTKIFCWRISKRKNDKKITKQNQIDENVKKSCREKESYIQQSSGEYFSLDHLTTFNTFHSIIGKLKKRKHGIFPSIEFFITVDTRHEKYCVQLKRSKLNNNDNSLHLPGLAGSRPIFFMSDSKQMTIIS